MARRKYRRRRRRRTYRKKRSARSILARAPLFGKSKMVKLRFCQAGQLSPGTSGGFTRWLVTSFNANAAGQSSVADPSLQPAGWNLIAPLFQTATTYGCKMSVTWLPSNSTSQHSMIPYIDKSTENIGGTLSPDLQQILNNKFVTYGLYANGPGNSSVIKRQMKFSTKSWFNLSDVKDVDEIAQPLPSTGGVVPLPTRRAFLNVGCSTTHPISTGLSQIDVVFVIDYLVLFTEPRNVS